MVTRNSLTLLGDVYPKLRVSVGRGGGSEYHLPKGIRKNRVKERKKGGGEALTVPTLPSYYHVTKGGRRGL